MYNPKVYTASKIRHGAMWRKLAPDYPIEWTARWVGFGDVQDHSSGIWSEEAKILHWIQDIQDVQRSDYVLAYAAEGDVNRGTYVEIGAAIGLGKIVLAVGFDLKHDSWTSHPLVQTFANLDVALSFIIGDLS